MVVCVSKNGGVKTLLPNYRHTEAHHPHHGVAPKLLQIVTIRSHHHLLLRRHHHTTTPFDSCMEAKPSRDFSAIDSTSGLLALLDLKEPQRHQHTHMEEIDLDSLEVVLDTPERSTAQRGQKCEHDIEVHSSNSRSSKLLEKPNRQTMRNRRRLSITNGGNRPLFRSMGGFRIGNEAEKNMHPTVTLIDSSPTVHAPTSSDRTKLDGSSSAFTEVLTSDDKIQGRKKENIDDLMSSQNVFSTSLHPCGKRTMRRKPVIHGNTSFGIGESSYNSVPVDVEGSHIESNGNQETEMNMFKPQQSSALPTITRHRRLVRNGCISPHNIAKAKHIAESEGKSSTNSKQDDIHQIFSNTIPTSEGNDNHKENQVKGKGLVIEMSPAQEYGAEPILPSTRSSQNTNKDANKIEDASGVASRSVEGISGWRSTRNRSNKTSFAMSDENLGRTSSDARHFNEAGDPVSFQHVPTEESVHGSSCTNSGLGVENGQHHAAHKLGKRQRRGPASSNLGECSSSSLEDLEVALLCPPKEASHARSSTSRNNHHNHRPDLVIDIDELSPEVRRRSPQSTTQRVNDDSDDRARQVEADEMLARELQEQFYGLPEIGGGEIDASLARYLQQEEERQRATVRGRQHVDSRDSSLSHLYRQYQFQNSIVHSRNNANRGRVPTSTRRARLRDRFSSHSPRIPSTTIPRGFQFPPNMDVEMRMHVLEALEAAVGENDDMAHLFQGHRDFNENDYEMLLALDEGIHQNRGASDAQINGLPQSTVQSDNFDEACAICLETPTIGDTIRHLPCLHKFHKDCIDPWLNRRTSCPVCKSDIT